MGDGDVLANNMETEIPCGRSQELGGLLTTRKLRHALAMTYHGDMTPEWVLWHPQARKAEASHAAVNCHRASQPPTESSRTPSLS
jgi:hypothetical protein